MNEQRQGWTPSHREQHFLWYLRLLMRYGVGGGGLIWAILTNHVEPITMMVLGALATSTDLIGFARDLVKAARSEEQALESQYDDESGK